MINKLLIKFKDKSLLKSNNKRLKKNKKKINKVIKWNRKIKWKKRIIKLNNMISECKNIKKIIIKWFIDLFVQIDNRDEFHAVIIRF